MIDTIQLRLGMRDQTGEMVEHATFHAVKNIIKVYYNSNITLSEYNNETYLKISYPRHYASSNAYLITSNKECLEFQREFVDTITRNVIERLQDEYRIEEVKKYLEKITLKLIRVDTPFTYRLCKEQNANFYAYGSIFDIMFEVYLESHKGTIKTVGKFDPNIRFDMNFIQSYICTDMENINKFNKKFQVYTQDIRLKECYPLESYKKIKKEYPDLPTRIRMEYIKRINRKEFTLEQFANFDLVCEYTLKFYTIILKEFFDEEAIQVVKKRNIKEITERLQEERIKSNFTISNFIYQYRFLIKDYDNLRRAIMNTSNNDNSGYKLCSTARALLESLEDIGGRKAFGTFKALQDIAEELKSEIKKIRKMVVETKKRSKR